MTATVELGKTFLEHFGVKGMKWGVRRSKRELANEAKNLTDDELRAAVNRMNMEQQFTRLSSGNHNRSAIAAGAAFVGGIALNVVRSQIQNQANNQVARVIANRASRVAG